ncbi:SCP-2 sterol transfer family protein [Geodermatophilus africanus]|uniref:SCP-2 sterol transfer family protein n=1 Tax=Geodermatophilus africanus TaxID=1137993 RepID=A0A1H3QC10_9ACTN|nr:SCP2 sterol-binding domain-containing protein [Geodermatophilus africanus]SDZ10628.1 SCP-2 sterol transfer family protein [Geodermatophilus africanus]
MTAIDDFFADLERRGHEPMLRRLSATVRWDILDGDRIDHRLVRIEHGDVMVAASDEPADCVIIAERAVCDDVVSGRTSALAALLRGAAAIDGDFELMVLAQRLLPRTPGASGGRAVVAAEGRPS